MNLLTITIIIAMVLTIAVLALGIGSMAHGGKFDEQHSEQFMTARVGLQALTLLLLAFAIYLAN